MPNTAHNVTVPTALERKGDFSQSVSSANHQPVKIYDPTNGQLFPGSVIPASRIWAPGQALLNLYPLPNQSLAANSNLPGGATYNYQTQLPGASPRREDLLRLDYNLTEKIRVFGHYIKDISNARNSLRHLGIGDQPADRAHFRADSGQQPGGGNDLHDHPDHDQRIQPGLHQQQHQYLRPKQWVEPVDPDGIQSAAGVVPRRGAGRLSASGGFWRQQPGQLTHVREFRCAVHQLQHHHRYHRQSDEGLAEPYHQGRLSTCSAAGRIRRPSEPSTAATTSATRAVRRGRIRSIPATGSANALLGVYQSFNQAQHHINGLYRYWNIEQYVQDTWKVTPRLTLDYGLRAAWYQPQYDASACRHLPLNFRSGIRRKLPGCTFRRSTRRTTREAPTIR